MGYNYADAFSAEEELTPDQRELIKAALIVALKNYRHEFPDAPKAHFTVFLSNPCIQVSGGPEIRVYTFEELGFKI